MCDKQIKSTGESDPSDLAHLLRRADAISSLANNRAAGASLNSRAADCIEALEAENARLRGALVAIAKDDHTQQWSTKPGQIARAALHGETQ